MHRSRTGLAIHRVWLVAFRLTETCPPHLFSHTASARSWTLRCSSVCVFVGIVAYILSFAISITFGHACVDDEESRNLLMHWILHSMSFSPYVVTVAWGVGYRSRFRKSLLMHRFARAFFAGAGLSATVSVTYPWLYTCHLGPVALTKLPYTIVSSAWVVCKYSSMFIIASKLRDLGRRNIARIIMYILVGIAPAVPAVLVASFHPELISENDLVQLLLQIVAVVPWWVMLSSVVFAGVCSLCASAQRTIHSDSSAQRRAGMWIMVTAVAAAASTVVSTFTPGFHIWHGSGSLHMSASLFLECVVDSLSVLVLAGLAGPPEVRRLALMAFTAINCYGDEQLNDFHLEFLQYLDDARIKRVRCGYLRQLASTGGKMPRCQDVPASEAIIGSAGFPGCKDDPKHRYVLSHPWLSKELSKLQMLCDQLDAMGADDSDCLFADYMSLPQHNMQDPYLQRLEREGNWPEPGTHPSVRTAEEDAIFKTSIDSMELLYSASHTPVIVLPMDECVPAGMEYISRGWCFLELCIAHSFGNIANADMCDVKLLCEKVRSEGCNTVEGFEVAFLDKRFTYAGDGDIVLRLFEKTVNRKAKLLCSATEAGVEMRQRV
ncbi:unnamed protein product [Prorocentrum cordatum]|uniref:Uncharacterized protein n=1 Tax=Prorocentrum cordatum TaxID=2364126 RepID=A0ABN9TU19_9DINO|nr:unnamed protein product [Polarella glacialis]